MCLQPEIEPFFSGNLDGNVSRSIIAFGASGGLRSFLQRTEGRASVQYVVDNDAEKWGRIIHDQEVFPPERLRAKKESELIVVCSQWYRSIVRQLSRMGFEPFKDFVLDVQFTFDLKHYLKIFETYVGFATSLGESLMNKRVLHIGVGQTLAVDVLMACMGARVLACNLDDESIFFPDARPKATIYRAVGEYTRNSGRTFPIPMREVVSIASDRVRFNPSRVVFATFNAEKMPLRDRSFDYVFSFDLLEHVSDPREVIREQTRILGPGGWFFHHIHPGEHRDGVDPFDMYGRSEEEWDCVCRGMGYLHNRWLAKSHSELLSEYGSVEYIRHGPPKAGVTPPDPQVLAPAFQCFVADDFIASTGFLELGGGVRS